MNCEDVRGELVHLHYGEADEALVLPLREHVETCDACSRELHALEATLSMTQGRMAPPLPEAVRERLWARIDAKQAGLWEGLSAIFGPMLLGAGTCLVTLYPLYHFNMLARTDPLVLIVGAVIWASIYNSVCTSMVNHARLRRLLAPRAGPGGQEFVGEVSEPEAAQGVRIQTVVYGLLVAFTGLFWSALVVLGPGATRSLHGELNTPQMMTGLSMVVLAVVGFGIGALDKRHAFTTSTLVSAIFCALGVPALYMICHGLMAPAEIMRGTALLMATSLVATGIGRKVELPLGVAPPLPEHEQTLSRPPGR